MRTELEKRIREVHSEGRLEIPDESKLLNGDYAEQIRIFIKECQENFNIKFVERRLTMKNQFSHITEKENSICF